MTTKKCDCGFEIEKGKKGCAEVIDEVVYYDKNGEIEDSYWIHCGEDEYLCDKCIKEK